MGNNKININIDLYKLRETVDYEVTASELGINDTNNIDIFKDKDKLSKSQIKNIFNIIIQGDIDKNKEISDEELTKIAKKLLGKSSTENQISKIKNALIKLMKKQRNVMNNNTGDIGLILFRPTMYKNEVTNTKEEINTLVKYLNLNKDLSYKTKIALKEAVEKGLFAFAHGVKKQEVLNITEKDASLLLKYSDEINKKLQSCTVLGREEREYLAKMELEFRRGYFQLHRIPIDPKKVKNKEVLTIKRKNTENDTRIIDNPETSVTVGAQRWTSPINWNSTYKNSQILLRNKGYHIGFETVESKGVNPYTSNGKIIDTPSRVLAEYSEVVADELSTTNQCFTGLKHTLLSAGIINDYGEIKDSNGKNISEPKNAVKWFQSQPEKFTEIKYVKDPDGVIRKINSTDIYDLPAGYFGIFVPEKSYKNEAGHAFTLNGNQQANGDHTDSIKWEYFAKGEHGTFHIFKLNSTNWAYNNTTQKLEFKSDEYYAQNKKQK